MHNSIRSGNIDSLARLRRLKAIHLYAHLFALLFERDKSSLDVKSAVYQVTECTDAEFEISFTTKIRDVNEIDDAAFQLGQIFREGEPEGLEYEREFEEICYITMIQCGLEGYLMSKLLKTGTMITGYPHFSMELIISAATLLKLEYGETLRLQYPKDRINSKTKDFGITDVMQLNEIAGRLRDNMVEADADGDAEKFRENQRWHREIRDLFAVIWLHNFRHLGEDVNINRAAVFI